MSPLRFLAFFSSLFCWADCCCGCLRRSAGASGQLARSQRVPALLAVLSCLWRVCPGAALLAADATFDHTESLNFLSASPMICRRGWAPIDEFLERNMEKFPPVLGNSSPSPTPAGAHSDADQKRLWSQAGRIRRVVIGRANQITLRPAIAAIFAGSTSLVGATDRCL